MSATGRHPQHSLLRFWILCLLVGFSQTQGPCTFPELGPWEAEAFKTMPGNLFPPDKVYLEWDATRGRCTLFVEEHVGEVVDPTDPTEFPLLQLKLKGDVERIDIRLSTTNGDIYPHLFKNPATTEWQIWTKKFFDYDEMEIPETSFQVTVIADSEPRSFWVQIVDINDNEPEITGRDPSRIPAIDELKAPSAARVVKIIAVDKDKNDVLKYTLSEDGKTSVHFRIEELTGEIFQTKALNYAEQSSHRLEVMVEDDRDPFHKDYDEVAIAVQDIPNLAPVFTRTPVLPATPEYDKSQVGDTVLTVNARDGDTGLNWEINYYLTDPLDLLQIHDQTGVITIKNPLDAESEELPEDLTYDVIITAREKVPPGYPDPDFVPMEESETVPFTIRDINDQPPRLCDESDSESKSGGFLLRTQVCHEKKEFSFVIDEDHVGEIQLDDDGTILVKDKDSTPRFNAFTAQFATGTPTFITSAFSISPRRGSSEETFTLSVADRTAIDFDTEEGHWHDVDGKSKEVEFTIEFIGTDDTTHKAFAHFKAKVVDVNDNAPKFQIPDSRTQYDFTVCENTLDGTALRNILADSSAPNVCTENEGSEIVVIASDGDRYSKEFGQDSVVYRWSLSSRQPPITLGEKDGKMVYQAAEDNGFDYERFKDEYFIVEALDREGGADSQLDTVTVHFKILDKNDENVDLRIESIRVTTDEGPDADDPVLKGIVATDVDLTANVQVSLSISDSMSFPDEVKNEVRQWFKLVSIGNGTGRVTSEIYLDRRKGCDYVGPDDETDLPDREGCGIMDVDRIDLTVTAQDMNADPEGSQITPQDVIIILRDVNDNPPEWPSPEEDYSDQYLTVQETEENDEQTPSQREIQKFRVIDKDTGTRFSFWLENDEDCTLDDPEICQEILEIFEFTSTNPISGTTVLSRKEDKPIDREDERFFPDLPEISTINLTFVASDGDFQLKSKIFINVTDINDNSPIFCEKYEDKSYVVDELATEDELIETICATDKDHPARYGKVTYLIENFREAGNKNGYGKFNIGLEGGELTPIEEAYDWFEVSEFEVQVKAIDDCNTGRNCELSRFTTEVLKIRVNDRNTHAPDFLTDVPEDEPIIKVKETEVNADEALSVTLPIRDRDDPSKPNGQISTVIEAVEKVPAFETDPDDLSTLFTLKVPDETEPGNVKQVQIIPRVSFKGLWGVYTLTVKASDHPNSDPIQRSSSRKFVVEIENENLNTPEFVWPEPHNEILYQISIRDSEPQRQLVDITNGAFQPIRSVHAIDKDKGSGPNGEIIYTLRRSADDECYDWFTIRTEEGTDNTTGMIVLRQALSEDQKSVQCNLTIVASDQGDEPNSDQNHLAFFLAWHENSPPEFSEPRTAMIEMKENQTRGTPSVKVEKAAVDEDIDNGNIYIPDDQIYYHFKGGEYAKFDLRYDDVTENGKPRRYPVISPKVEEVIDREEKDVYTIVIYCSNFENDNTPDKNPADVDPNDVQWMILTINVLDIVDTAPIFDVTNDLVTAGFSEISRIGDALRTIIIIDPDLDDPVDTTISTDIVASDPSLPINPAPFTIGTPTDRSVQILLQFDPKPTFRGFYEFQLTATDSAGMTALVNCKIYMVTRRHIITFTFLNDLAFFEERKDELAEIFTEAFSYRCNIDRVIPNVTSPGVSQVLSSVIVETHFINLDNNEPVNGSLIADQRFSPDVMRPLLEALTEKHYILVTDGGINGPQQPITETDPKEVVMYVLIGGVTILIVALLIIGATCFYNNRSLSRRVRALTATTFGSQQSDLNRAGVTMNAPNTNAFAVEGSNPIWTVDADKATAPPNFDAESIGSGGSVLIGAEDEDYFQKSSRNPAFEDVDIVENYNSADDDLQNHYYTEPYNVSGGDAEPDSQPITFGAARTTKNPLMAMAGGPGHVEIDAIDELDEVVGSHGYENESEIVNDNFTMF